MSLHLFPEKYNNRDTIFLILIIVFIILITGISYAIYNNKIDNQNKTFALIFIFILTVIILYLLGYIIYIYIYKSSFWNFTRNGNSYSEPSNIISEETLYINDSDDYIQPNSENKQSDNTDTGTSSNKDNQVKTSREKQVFNVSKNIYTYNDAMAVCSAFDSKLADYNQIQDAYNDGGEWCNYGWSKDQMALYPTQQSIWDKLQNGPSTYKNACGHVGINGGYFENPNLKFGVNCYGHKPVQSENTNYTNTQPYPIDYITEDQVNYNNKVTQYKNDLTSIDILPFNYSKWDE